ncbi:hypothetical protein FHS29_006701 [Saccharothrix tamanrassetensis]|uniref:Uncharacterized protein n=1 Tax=Saccharothrix tamanrassetensis TaxID=1051531 RepID=A0A841CVB3_9PSEU|nr:hypothetical protein [Saccharothrix tamanrassetensis]MBB5960078.1 hypothetical protein [Saccharothrix tamanrassetensis]
MAKTVDPARVEQEARTRFAEMGAAGPAARDQRGVDHEPPARYVEILRRARLIAISDGLAEAVIARLAEKGVRVAVDQVRVDPAENDEQVIAIAGTVGGVAAVIPIRPGASVLRAYPAGPDLVLAGEPLATVELSPKESDRWVGAAAIADALADHLR